MPTLPQGTTFDARRMEPTVFPVLAYSLTSDNHSLVELRDIALYQLRPLLSTIPGVAKIEVLGGAQREYQVNLDPARLDAYGLSLSDVSKSLSAANVIAAVGRMEDRYKLYLAMRAVDVQHRDAPGVSPSGVERHPVLLSRQHLGEGVG